MSDAPCPCSSGRTFEDCCRPILSGTPALTAEALMRSRYVVVSFTTLIPRLPHVDMFDFMKRQLPVMRDFVAKTAGVSGLADYHKHYRDCAAEMQRMLKPRSAASS